MSTTQHVSTGRRAVAALLAVTAFALVATSLTRDLHLPEHGRGRARGDRGPPADRRQPCGHHRSGVRTRELPTRDDGGAPPLRGRPPADDPDVPVRAARASSRAATTSCSGSRSPRGRSSRPPAVDRSFASAWVTGRAASTSRASRRAEGASASRPSSSHPRRLGEHRVAVVMPTKRGTRTTSATATATASATAGTPTRPT